MSNIVSTVGLFFAGCIFITCILTGIPIMAAMIRAGIVLVATYIGGFAIVAISMVILNPSNTEEELPEGKSETTPQNA